MTKHLRFQDETVETRSTAGRVAESLLDLNSPALVRYRRFVIDLIGRELWRRGELLADLAKLRKKPKSTLVDQDTEKILGFLMKVDESLLHLCGQEFRSSV